LAYLKFSRDRRGYEHFYLVQPAARGKARPRVLYWFRTPPGVKIGRPPFDPEMRRALEAQYPDVAFDWEAIARTPIPPPAEPERWRERRRVERAFRGGASGEETALNADTIEQSLASEIEAAPAIVTPIEEPAIVANGDSDPTATAVAASNVTSPDEPPHAAAQGDAARQGHRHKRRRRGRRRSQVQGSEPESGS
jgi:hypothetical protein